MTDVLATAANAAYGFHALNLVGSVQRNSDIFDRIEVFDLGLAPAQRSALDAATGVVLREVPPFVPHWASCFTWKPWGWMQVEADRVFWIDAGSSVLRSLGAVMEAIDERGYFLVSQGNALRDILPPDYFTRYGVPAKAGSRPYVAAGIIGFRPDGEFFESVLVPTYEDCLAGLNLGFSPGEMRLNRGLGLMADPPVRDCAQFRWDQSVLNARLAATRPDAEIASLEQYAGWRSPRDHPDQVIWNHRRPASLEYLLGVRYDDRYLRRRLAGLRLWARWWLRMHDTYFRPVNYRLKLLTVWQTYRLKLRSIWGILSGG